MFKITDPTSPKPTIPRHRAKCRQQLLSGGVLPREVDVGVVVDEDKQRVGVLLDFPHEGLHLGVNVTVQTHHVLVGFLIGRGDVFDPQVHEHSWAKQRKKNYFWYFFLMICDPGRWKSHLWTQTWLSDALRRLVYQNVRWRNQNEKVHFTKTAQIKIVGPWVSDGADLRKEAPGHTQLGWVDLKDLGQQLCYRGKKRENACKYTH